MQSGVGSDPQASLAVGVQDTDSIDGRLDPELVVGPCLAVEGVDAIEPGSYPDASMFIFCNRPDRCSGGHFRNLDRGDDAVMLTKYPLSPGTEPQVSLAVAKSYGGVRGLEVRSLQHGE